MELRKGRALASRGPHLIQITLPARWCYQAPETGFRLDVARKHSDVPGEPASDVVFRGFGDSSLDFELRVWTVKQVQTPQVMRSELYFSILEAFRQHGIEIPFPQRDLHLRSSEIALPFAPGMSRSRRCLPSND